MPQPIRVEEMVASRTAESSVRRNINISETLPPAGRVVSVNARVETTDIDVGRGYIIINGIVRATIYYASQDDPSDVVSFRRSFSFSDRINIRGARPGLDVNAASIISDIDFSLLNERTIRLEFTIESDIEITAPDVISPIDEVPEIEFERRRYRTQRQVRERNFSRDLSSVERLDDEAADIRRIVDIDSSIQILETVTGYNRVRVRGVVNNNILYVNTAGNIVYEKVSYGFNGNFVFQGITSEMRAFVEAVIRGEEVSRIDSRRVKLNASVLFRIVVVEERVIEVPTEIVTPDRFYPVRRTVIVERLVAEERTRIQLRRDVNIPEGNPDVQRVIQATGNLTNVDSEAEKDGVFISGVINASIVYAADLPQQPVYFAPGRISFNEFISIPKVRSNMLLYTEINLDRITASVISSRRVQLRAVLDVNLIVTERVRVPVITDISDRPITEKPSPEIEPEAEYLSYIVKSGDTLFLIARRFGVSMNVLVDINDIADPSQINVGQRLLIPGT